MENEIETESFSLWHKIIILSLLYYEQKCNTNFTAAFLNQAVLLSTHITITYR